MLHTSQDLLYIIVALCTLTFTAFLIWIMYYVAQIMRQSNEVISDVREQISELSKSINGIKEKLTSASTSIAFVSDQIADIVKFIKDKKTKKKK